MTISIFETYDNDVRPHGWNIHKMALNMDMVTRCLFPSDNYVMPHCNCGLLCFAN